MTSMPRQVSRNWRATSWARMMLSRWTWRVTSMLTPPADRFATLRKTDRAFAGLPAGSVVRRRLFGHDIEIDLSRSQAQQLLFVEGERFVDERFLLKKLK